MDISRCRRGLTHETVAGTYIYPDGTIKQNATMGDILTNLLAVRKEAPDLLTAERIVRNHTLTRARMAQDMSNKLLDGGLICRPSPGALSGETIHTELRRLLWYSVPAHVRREAWQFSILIFSSGLAGVGAGFTTALAAYVVQYRNNHGDERHNKTLTDREVRNEWIIAGVATFFATLAAGIADDIQLRRVLRFRVAEAFPADAFLAMTIDALRRLEMYPENSAPDSPGDNPRDIEMPTHPRRATIPCVDADIAANVARSFGDSLLPQVPQLGDVFHVEAPRVVEAEMLKEIVTDGRCTLAG
ncbi:MAG: hypothetical protein L6R38_009507 [Xanthoria sp. 2 TBL-2021]|nr:MAG: hypothetical protein L6R38_009507 [Xanthoria sp. 2 TBL-2021]